MPLYAYLRADLRYPNCGSIVHDWLSFQWGYAPGTAPREEYVYRIGDPVRWRWHKGEGIISWAFFAGDEPWVDAANFGDPSVRDLIVRDATLAPVGAVDEQLRCERCGAPIEGAAVEIRDNIIRRAWIYQPGELDGEADVYLMRDEGRRLVPMPEWNEGIISTIRYSGRGWRAVAPELLNGEWLVP